MVANAIVGFGAPEMVIVGTAGFGCGSDELAVSVMVNRGDVAYMPPWVTLINKRK